MLRSMAFGVAVLCSGMVMAGEVAVTEVHLCCGQCVKRVADSLKGVDGVTNAACDKDAGKVTFTASGADAAKAGVAALAKAGFHGKAVHGDAVVAFPKSGVKADAKADSVTLGNVHLCCGGCKKAASEAAKGVDGVTGATCDGDAETITVTGSDFNVKAVVDALYAAGFHAKATE